MIAGNFIGTDVTGTLAMGNGSHGIAFGFQWLGEFLAPPTGNIVGGSRAVERNIIAGNHGYGILVDQSDKNVIQGNYVGTDVTGQYAIPNATVAPGGPPAGILIANSQGTQIGGGTPGSGNLISGNVGLGLAVWYAESEGNIIQGNLIGTDRDGNYAIANTGGGLSTGAGGHHSVVGTDGDGVNDALEGNIISGNQDPDSPYTYGLGLGDFDIVAGNRIGTDVTGTKAIPNATGMAVGGGGNRIGTDADGVSDELERNIIAGNLYDGIAFGYGAAWNVVAGNYVGLDVNGGPLGNGGGISIGNAHNNLIGTDADSVAR